MPIRDNDCLLEFEDSPSFLILEDDSGFLALEICAPVPPAGEAVPTIQAFFSPVGQLKTW